MRLHESRGSILFCGNRHRWPCSSPPRIPWRWHRTGRQANCSSSQANCSSGAENLFDAGRPWRAIGPDAGSTCGDPKIWGSLFACRSDAVPCVSCERLPAPGASTTITDCADGGDWHRFPCPAGWRWSETPPIPNQTHPFGRHVPAGCSPLPG